MKTVFYQMLQKRIMELGGCFNSHLHLDRYNTLDNQYLQAAELKILENSHISLLKKHGLLGALHAGPAFEKDNLIARVNDCLDIMVACNTKRADTMVDVTADNVQLSNMEWMRSIKNKRAHEIDIRLAAYSPFGFCDDEPERWDIYQQGAQLADFLGCLPEADDVDDYPSHIGFMAHLQRVLELAQDLNIPVHVHTDQRNEPSECGTERLVEAVKRYGAPPSSNGEPSVWAVHMVSPSTYPEDRFERLVENLLEYNIGVIVCPSAGVGMRQLRPVSTPTYNSIPRVLELLAAGVQVRLGSDNIADICSPSTTPDLIDEVFVLSAAIRYYDVEVLAHLAAGKALNPQQRETLKQHLALNDIEISRTLNVTRTAMV